MNELQTISLVTVTHNSQKYLDATLQSVFQQAYPALDYMVIDRASTDGTQAIIKDYAKRLSYWETVVGKGVYDALQIGFAHSAGSIMGFLPSDALHLPHTLATVNAIFHDLPQIEWISSLRPMLWNETDEPLAVKTIDGFHKEAFLRSEHLSSSIRPEATFWRRSLWEKIGGNLDTSLSLAGDIGLWSRFYQHTNLVGVRTILAGFRSHNNQHSQAYHEEAVAVLKRHGGRVQGTFETALRKHIAPIVPRRLKRAASSFGITFRASNAVYNLKKASWVLRYDYI